MAKTKEELKEIFVEGHKPTEQDFADLIDGVQGPKGTKGDKGEAGFPTEEQWDALIGRIDVLEAK